MNSVAVMIEHFPYLGILILLILGGLGVPSKKLLSPEERFKRAGIYAILFGRHIPGLRAQHTLY